MWLFRAILFFKCFEQTGQMYPDEPRCLASMWFLTMVRPDVYPHSEHCHWPPPRLVIMVSASAATLNKSPLNNLNFYSVSVRSGHVIIQSHPIFDMLWADMTAVTSGSSVLGLYVVFDNCFKGLVAALQTLPLSTTKTCHQFVKINCNEKQSS